MPSLTPTQVRRLRNCLIGAAATLLLGSVGACTLLLDRSTTQCRTDSDCLSLGVVPSCQSGVCVNTNISCFVGVPESVSDFENRCVTGQCTLQFDDCTRLHVCDGAGPPLVDPPPPDAGTADASIEAPSVRCADLPPGQGGTVYVTGSSNFPTVLSAVVPLLVTGVAPNGQGPAIVWLTSSSCQGADAIFSGNPAASVMRDPPHNSPLSSYAQYYYQEDGGPIPCLLGDAGVPVDIGESDVFSTTCNASYTISATNDLPGPIQEMEFIVPELSDQASISREAAREVFGLGGNDGGAYPWTNLTRYYVRNKNTGTQQMIANAIGVPANEFWGVDRGTASNVLSDLQSLAGNVVEAEQAIGILSNDVYDSSRANVRALAYQDTGQNCAYLPDSTVDSYDKQNVRDGHYPIWGPLHFFTSNQPSSQVLSFLTYFTGATTTPAILDAFIATNLIPNCAMTVLRSENSELSALVSYQPTNSCECYFLSRAQPPSSDSSETLPAPGAPVPGHPECRGCSTAGDCPASRPVCNFNYCEVQ